MWIIWVNSILVLLDLNAAQRDRTYLLGVVLALFLIVVQFLRLWRSALK